MVRGLYLTAPMNDPEALPINTAMIGYEGGHLGRIERSLRAVVGVGLLIQIPVLQIGLLVVGILIVVQRRLQARRKDAQKL